MTRQGRSVTSWNDKTGKINDYSRNQRQGRTSDLSESSDKEEQVTMVKIK